MKSEFGCNIFNIKINSFVLANLKPEGYFESDKPYKAVSVDPENCLHTEIQRAARFKHTKFKKATISVPEIKYITINLKFMIVDIHTVTIKY